MQSTNIFSAFPSFTTLYVCVRTRVCTCVHLDLCEFITCIGSWIHYHSQEIMLFSIYYIMRISLYSLKMGTINSE